MGAIVGTSRARVTVGDHNIRYGTMSHMSTVFSKIINRELPGFFIYEDDICVAIMDKYRVVVGKEPTVILRREAPYVFDLTDDEYRHLFAVARRVAKALTPSLRLTVAALLLKVLRFLMFISKSIQCQTQRQILANATCEWFVLMMKILLIC